MKGDAPRVLVIDDDEVVLVAVSDLLEEHGYRVYTLGSPIGATQVIVREDIDLAVIDVNLPEMQGDSVVRLLRSWDRLKDLPVVMLSGADASKLEQVQRELPGITVVRKTAMNHDLVITVNQVLAVAMRGVRPPRPTGANARAAEDPQSLRSTRDVLQAFLDELAETMTQAKTVWDEITHNDFTRVPATVRGLDAMRRRAQLVNAEVAGQLLEALGETIGLMKPGRTSSRRSERAVEDAIAALAALHTSRNRDFGASPTFLIQDLRDIAAELRTNPY